MRFLALLSLVPGLALGAIGVQWQGVTDERVETYRITCNNELAVEVPFGTHTAVLNLDPGHLYTCVATSYSKTLGLESAPSNELVLDLKLLPAPSTLKIKIIIEVTQ